MEEDPFGHDGGGASFTCRRGCGDGDGDGDVVLLLTLDDNEKGVVGVTLAFLRLRRCSTPRWCAALSNLSLRLFFSNSILSFIFCVIFGFLEDLL